MPNILILRMRVILPQTTFNILIEAFEYKSVLTESVGKPQEQTAHARFPPDRMRNIIPSAPQFTDYKGIFQFSEVGIEQCKGGK
jgi:hypothetical protein